MTYSDQSRAREIFDGLKQSSDLLPLAAVLVLRERCREEEQKKDKERAKKIDPLMPNSDL